VEDPHLGPERLEEEQRELRRVETVEGERNEDDPDHERDRDLEDELRARGEAEVSLLRDLQVVVEEADPAERDGGSADDPDEGIEEVRPQKGGPAARRGEAQ